MFLHLEARPRRNAHRLEGFRGASRGSRSQPADALTEYGVRKNIQTLLAGIRTDLDSFSDVEAFALMSSGYRMAAFYLPQVEVLPKRLSPPVDWRFLAIDKVISGASTTDPRYLRVVKLLGSGGSRMFRIWQQSRALLLATSLLCVAAIVLIGALLIGENLLSEGVEVTGWRALIVLLVAIAMVVPTVREHVSRVSRSDCLGSPFASRLGWVSSSIASSWSSGASRPIRRSHPDPGASDAPQQKRRQQRQRQQRGDTLPEPYRRALEERLRAARRRWRAWRPRLHLGGELHCVAKALGRIGSDRPPENRSQPGGQVGTQGGEVLLPLAPGGLIASGLP